MLPLNLLQIEEILPHLGVFQKVVQICREELFGTLNRRIFLLVLRIAAMITCVNVFL